MKVGAEKNKVILLAVVSVIAAYTVYSQFFSGPMSQPAPRPAASAKQARQTQRPQRRQSAAARSITRGGNFRPVFGPGSDEEPLDPMVIDPTLRTELWMQVKSVEFEGVTRDLFRFGERRKPVVAAPDPDKVAEAQKRLQDAQRAKQAAAQRTPAPVNPVRKAPPISFKYYGFASASGDPQKRAFLLDDEEVLIGAEGDIFKKRYKIIRIGINSIVVEDMEFKDQQTLLLQEGPA